MERGKNWSAIASWVATTKPIQRLGPYFSSVLKWRQSTFLFICLIALGALGFTLASTLKMSDIFQGQTYSANNKLENHPKNIPLVLNLGATINDKSSIANGRVVLQNTADLSTAGAIQSAAAVNSGSYVQLQPATPGSQQIGNLRISGTAIAATFSGSGAPLTSLNASSLSSGTVSDARLSNNVALLNGTGPQTFTGNNRFTGTFLQQDIVNSTAAFQIQNATATSNLFVADTVNGRIGIGTASPSALLDVGRGALRVVNAGPVSFSGLTPRLNADYLPSDIVSPTISNGKYNGFGIMVQFPDGQLAIVYRQGNTHVGVGDYGVIVMRTSSDQGRTWSGAVTIASNSGLDLRNVGGGIAPDGRLVVFYPRYNPDTATWIDMGYIYSEDEGVTWSPYTTVSHNTRTEFSSYAPMVAIGSGKLMQGWYGSTGSSYAVYTISSSDNGKTWGNEVQVLSSSTAQYTETAFAYLGGGYISFLARADNGGTFTQGLSSDNGATWVNQGETTFDTWSIPSPPTLAVFRSLTGQRMVAAYYVNRNQRQLRVVYALGKDLINNGTAGWQTSTLRNIQSVPDADSGYIGVVHPFGDARSTGWFYDNGSIMFFNYGDIPTVLTNLGIGTVNPQQALVLSSASNIAVEMAVPASAPTGTAGTSGAMATGTYYYRVTALDGQGETMASNESAAVSVIGPNGSVALSWPAVPKASSYKIYRTVVRGQYSSPSFIATATTNSYSDIVISPLAGAAPSTTSAYTTFLSATGPSWLLGGNVGIGTTAPATPWSKVLQVYDANNSALSVKAGGTGRDWQISTAADGLLNIYDNTAGAHRLNIDTAGKVGIGTTAPSALLHVAGTALFQNNSNSTTAFQIQNIAGTSLLTVDTTNAKITVTTLVVSTSLTLNGHFITGGTVPGISAGAGAGTGPIASVSGNDQAGTITVTTGISPGIGTLATITFVTAYESAPRVLLTPVGNVSASLQYNVGSSSINTFTLNSNNAPLATTTYIYNYWVAQ